MHEQGYACVHIARTIHTTYFFCLGNHRSDQSAPGRHVCCRRPSGLSPLSLPENLRVRGALLGVVENSGDHVVSAGCLSAAEHHPHVEGLVEDIGVSSGNQLYPGPAVGAGKKRLDTVCSRDAGRRRGTKKMRPCQHKAKIKSLHRDPRHSPTHPATRATCVRASHPRTSTTVDFLWGVLCSGDTRRAATSLASRRRTPRGLLPVAVHFIDRLGFNFHTTAQPAKLRA